MAPLPQKAIQDMQSMDGERVVISGMSGLFPESKHVKDFERILYNKENPVNADKCRWSFNHPDVRNYSGKIPQLSRFDGQFFKVSFLLGNSMDPMSKKLLEQSYQAIYDAGVNPSSLSGKNVAVFVGTCFSETEKSCFYVAHSRRGLGIAGCNKAMFANRISYWLNAKGPSMSIDESCCSSLAALEQAYLSISRGECEAAVVGGACVCLHPHSYVHYGRMMTPCQDGKTKSFDEKADGYAKSEAVSVLFIQKAKDAKRIYADLVHVMTEFTNILEDDTSPRYGFYRNPANVADFLKYFYKKAHVDPGSVEYVEAFGSGVPEADKSELEAIDEVFCKNRSGPLSVGSVMSNIGYTEAATGLSAVTKVLLAYHNGKIAANLHYENPRRDITAIQDGRLQIVTKNQDFQRSYVAVNGIAVTGVNAHVLLRGCYKPKDPNRYKSPIPHLVTISARQDTAVERILQDLKTRPIDPEELALFHSIHEESIAAHLGRGYTILSTNEKGETISLSETANYFDDAKRPLWFVYSGMGSQWSGMGLQLMKIPVFAAAIERCHKVLEPKGVDIIHIITSPDKTIFDNILNSFVGIAAVQIGLTDVLTSLGIVPDKVIGHSVGELGCAYADGCFTAEEMILSAYSRGLVSVQTPFIKGSMAAVGIGYQQMVKLLPPEIQVACHNSFESCTISGPADSMKKFVAELTAQGIFAKEVPSSNIAYHSRYIAEAGPGLLKYLSEIIKDPKPRSDRWLSTSVPEEKWNEPQAKFCSAYYHTNNLLSPVLFEETSHHIPYNAILVEIAPHGLLQAILKRALPESCINIPMTRRGHPDNAFMVLDAVGKIFMGGHNPKVKALYPEVEFPVSTETPFLSHLVEWAHQEQWKLLLYSNAFRIVASTSKSVISLEDKEHRYLRSHVLRGKTVYPWSAALVAVWDTLAMSLGQQRQQISVQFQDLELFVQPTFPEKQPLRLSVNIHRGNGRFEIMENKKNIVMTGFIMAVQEANFPKISSDANQNLAITSEDVYRIFYDRDYLYRDIFRSIHKANNSFTKSQIKWNGNWVGLLDGIIQMIILNNGVETATVSYIKTLSININEHIKNIVQSDGRDVIVAEIFETENVLRCGGVLLSNACYRTMPLPEEVPLVLKSLEFVPRVEAKIDTPTTIQVYLQIVAENINKNIINVVKIQDGKDNTVFDDLKSYFYDIPDVEVHYEVMPRDNILLNRDRLLKKFDLVLTLNLALDENLCQLLYRVLPLDTFLINAEDVSNNIVHKTSLYRVKCTHSSNRMKLELIKWRPTQLTSESKVVTVRSRSELSLLKSASSELPERQKLVILTSYPPVAGLKELVKRWRAEACNNQIYLAMVSDRDSLENLPDFDLAYNILVDGKWGGEYYTSCQNNKRTGRGATLRCSRVSDLDSLHWVETDDLTSSLGLQVKVHYAAINELDVKKAVGMVPTDQHKDTAFCMDFSGVTECGDRVMGIVPSGAASGRVDARPELLWPVPAHWSLEDAATVPSAYAHAFYCLGIKVKLHPGFRVLVYGGAGALGQAVISIALGFQCEVFAAVSDIRKKRFLMRLFPELKEDHIGNSRDETFVDMVLSVTKGKGCDITICCVRNEFMRRLCCNAVGDSGCMVDVLKLQNERNYPLNMESLTHCRHYFPVDLTSIFKNNRVEDMKTIQTLISEGIARGYVRPLSRVTYATHDVGRAFRLVAGSCHRGRVLIDLRNNVVVPEPRLSCSPNHCHLVLCGETTFGIQCAERLVERGARMIHLHGAKVCPTTQMKIKSWEAMGVKVQCSSEDLTYKGVVSLLNQCNRLGPVEGIFVIATGANEQMVDKLTALVANLDAASRKLCPSIRSFAVITSGLNLGQQMCLERQREHLPVTLVNLPAFRTSDNMDAPNQPAPSWRDAINVIEKALRTNHTSLLAIPRKKAPPPLLKQIADVAGIEIWEEVSEKMTLLDLRLDFVKVPAVRNFLRNTHNIALSEDFIPSLTLKRIKELDKMINGCETKKVSGLETFISYVDPDELTATIEMVFPSTFTRQSNLVFNEFDVNEPYLFIVPGLEGHHKRFETLCERLKLSAIVLQPGLDYLSETYKETADRYTKLLLNKACVHNGFYLLGYETGVIVALEMAAILEELGVTGTVFCVGCTPEELKGIIDDNLKNIQTDEALQDEVVHHMFRLMTGNSNEEELDIALTKVTAWKDKVETCVRTLLGKVAHSAQYARNWIEAAYLRIKAARDFKEHPQRLKSKVILMRAEFNSDLSPVTSLQRYSHQPVEVYELKEMFANAAYDLRCSAVVNDHLDAKILQAFVERNHCDSYDLRPGMLTAVEVD